MSVCSLDRWLPEEHAVCISRVQLREFWEVAGHIETSGGWKWPVRAILTLRVEFVWLSDHFLQQ